MSKILLPYFLKQFQEPGTTPFKNKEGEWGHREVQSEDVLKFFCKSTLARNCFLTAYKDLPPIETIPNEEKVEWRKFVNESFPGTTPQFRTDAIRIMYTVGCLTN